MKFDRARSAAAEIGAMLPALLTDCPDNVLLAHVPTASSRIRQRGYDQARLIALAVADRSDLKYHNLLFRKSSGQQHGASRKTRLEQAKNAFSVRNSEKVKGTHIILVDDVLTTGATLESAAKTLKSAGAKRVEAIVFAQG